jgi:hypothetical protein
MKQIFAVIFLLTISSHAFRNLEIWIWFKLNQQEIADKFCIFRDVPLAMCNGHCYLEKKLAEHDSNNPQLPVALLLEERPITMFFSPVQVPLIKQMESAPSFRPSPMDEFAPKSSLKGRLFRPPRC